MFYVALVPVLHLLLHTVRALAAITQYACCDNDSPLPTCPQFVWSSDASRAKKRENRSSRKTGSFVTIDGAGIPSTAAGWSPHKSVNASLAIAEPCMAATEEDGEPVLHNQQQISGRIALIERGFITLTKKALAAQNAGAVGVIIMNNDEPKPDEPVIFAKHAGPMITKIPVIAASYNESAQLLNLGGSDTTISLEFETVSCQASCRECIQPQWWLISIATAFVVRIALLPLVVMKWLIRVLLLWLILEVNVTLRLIGSVLTFTRPGDGQDTLEKAMDRNYRNQLLTRSATAEDKPPTISLAASALLAASSLSAFIFAPRCCGRPCAKCCFGCMKGTCRRA